MTSPIAVFFTWQLAIRRKTGDSSTGATYADWDTSATYLWKIRQETRTVVDADGNEVVSSATCQASADVPRVPAGSKVTLPAEFGGATARVVAEATHDSGLSALPSYYEINLA